VTNTTSGPPSAAPATPFARTVRRIVNPGECRTARDFALYGLFVGGFLAALAWFSFVDVYNQHFFSGAYGAVHNVFRVVFTAYLFWLVSFVGQRSLAFAASADSVAAVRLHERLALGFFVGAAVITIIMLVLGYLSLYWRVIAALIVIPVIAVSYRDFALALGEARSGLARAVRDGPLAGTILSAAMLLAVFLSGAVLLLVKGLYPQGGHDYYLHYSQFYTLVIDNHGVWPNAFWYQYYYSKGMGLTFLGMLLSDPLAPSLVTYCFVVSAALALYSLVNRVCPRTLWPWVAVVLYFALNVHTLGTGFYAANGGWGHFQKPHEINAPFLIAILWMSACMVQARGAEARAWWLGAAACSFIVAHVMTISSAIVGLFALLATVAFSVFDRANARAFFGFAVAAGLGLVSVLVINYLTTGIPSDIGVNAWWPIIDFQVLKEAGTLFDVTNVAYRRAQAVATGVSFTGFDLLDFMRNAGRFDILGSLMYGALAGAVVCASSQAVLRFRFTAYRSSVSATTMAAGGVFLAFFVAITFFTVIVGPGEPVSYVRVSSFALPLMIAAAAIIWQLAIATVNWPGWLRGLLAYVVPIALAGLTLVQAYDDQKKTLRPVLANALRLVDGRYSIYDGYRDQSGWPALPDSRAIYPGIFEAWKSIGPGHRIWSFNVHSYCMVPGCRIESHLSAKMSAYRAEILYGTADAAREVLQREGLNYFFISTYLDIRDPLICTPLFSPNTIWDYLGVKWTDGTDVLLTWKGPGIQPISAQWIEKYRADLKASPHTPDCSGNGPPFSYHGHRVYNDVMKGKRWGSEIEPPK
jgi:hypothetical protein